MLKCKCREREEGEAQEEMTEEMAQTRSVWQQQSAHYCMEEAYGQEGEKKLPICRRPVDMKLVPE